MNIKKEKGAIAIFVLVTLLFMVGFLIINFASNVNKSKTVDQQKEIINSIYSKQGEDINDEYNEFEAQPIIDEIPDPIIISVTEIKDPYVKYNTMGGTTEYTALNNKFATMQEMVDYVIKNNKYGEVEVFIKANGNNGKTAETTKKITFVEPLNPVISDLPNPIITNVTEIRDSYAQYGILGGNTKFLLLNKEFNSLKEVEEYVKTNNKYEKLDITIIANDNNTKQSESKQNIEFIKGMKATNEAELNTAFTTVGDLYIQVANNIECTNSIYVDNVSHRLDLNNKIISFTKENESFHFITLGSNANLTITDSSIEKNGTILTKLFQEVNSDGKTRTNTITGIRNYGTLTIESGKVKADLVQKMLNRRDGTTVEDTCSAIENVGIVNLNGGTIESNIETQGAVYLVVKRAKANGRGITNTGTVNLNSGSIITNAIASVIRVTGATVSGKTYAYAYGILGSGKINDSNNVTFVTKATANTSGTYYTDSDNLNMAENSKIAIDDDDQ